ncbi:hypothetical protein JOF56_009508 [Kibdelosporangium banguiense]|uniref:Ricin B lectin domain-containing protein n=1 Tax=Kibdelosporangium banguiense TaxID=1365924 RepID=A0ABS4TYQ2_9PSEU|nr:RICIN domain-containing protein [Kibdelosporangium banguiense]MBP2329123.1 hypothetical protein [Kibdelosporangium banguiense]
MLARRLFSVVAVVTALLFASNALADAEDTRPPWAKAEGITGISGPWRIQNYNGYCMDIAANRPGTVIGMNDCHSPNYTSQWWYFYSYEGTETFRNYNGYCADIASNASGTVVGITDCHYLYSSQQWVRYSDRTIRNYGGNGKCMDLGSNAKGTPVVIAECRDGYTSQWWYLLAP